MLSGSQIVHGQYLSLIHISWADNDPDEKNHNTPILGANDGASGVGALLEIARLVNQQQPELGKMCIRDRFLNMRR